MTTLLTPVVTLPPIALDIGGKDVAYRFGIGLGDYIDDSRMRLQFPQLYEWRGTPAITQLMPDSTPAGGAAFPLVIHGTGFGTDAIVYWGTMTRTTTYNTTTEVTADITAADIMNAGTIQVYVHTAGANSNTMTFTIQ